MREMAMGQGKVEHVHHGTVQEGSVAAFNGEEHRLLERCARVKDQPVERAVYDVAHGTGEDQRQAHHEPCSALGLDRLPQEIADPYHGHHAEKRKGHLAELTTELQPEGHALVLHELEIGPCVPLPEKRDGFPQEEAELHPELQGLVGH